MVVQPPAILVRMGLVPPGVLWKFNKALYGLRCAPKRWGKKRDSTLKTLKCIVDGEEACFEQCETTKGLWKVKTGKGIVGIFIVYVDDALAMGSTKWVEAIMSAFSKSMDMQVRWNYCEGRDRNRTGGQVTHLFANYN